MKLNVAVACLSFHLGKKTENMPCVQNRGTPRSTTISISYGSCNKSPQTWWLTSTNFIHWYFWKMKVQNYGIGGTMLPSKNSQGKILSCIFQLLVTPGFYSSRKALISTTVSTWSSSFLSVSYDTCHSIWIPPK